MEYKLHITSVFLMQDIVNDFYGRVMTSFLQLEYKLSLPVKTVGIWWEDDDEYHL